MQPSARAAAIEHDFRAGVKLSLQGIRPYEGSMIAEAKQSYRVVICIHCYQSTPLTPSAESKEQRHKDGAQSTEDEFAIFSNPLRCRACGKEAVYTAKDVRDFEGSPRKRPRRRSATSSG
jgi:hypothetical protein